MANGGASGELWRASSPGPCIYCGTATDGAQLPVSVLGVFFSPFVFLLATGLPHPFSPLSACCGDGTGIRIGRCFTRFLITSFSLILLIVSAMRAQTKIAGRLQAFSTTPFTPRQQAKVL